MRCSIINLNAQASRADTHASSAVTSSFHNHSLNICEARSAIPTISWYGAIQIMPIRPIIRYPDPRLALPAQPVTAFDGALRDLANDLLETMHAAPGIGITAPHIGIALRVVVLDLDPVDGARTYVNPEIIWASPDMIVHQEGSVSMPGVNDEISRHARVRISYQDVDGNLRTEESEGLRAICHQHEIDQLNGLFWIKRLSRLKRERLVKRFEKMSRG